MSIHSQTTFRITFSYRILEFSLYQNRSFGDTLCLCVRAGRIYGFTVRIQKRIVISKTTIKCPYHSLKQWGQSKTYNVDVYTGLWASYKNKGCSWRSHHSGILITKNAIFGIKSWRNSTLAFDLLCTLLLESLLEANFLKLQLIRLDNLKSVSVFSSTFVVVVYILHWIT